MEEKSNHTNWLPWSILVIVIVSMLVFATYRGRELRLQQEAAAEATRLETEKRAAEKKHEERIAEATERLLAAATSIVTEPNLWIDGNEAISDYISASIDLNLADDKAVSDFQDQALQFIVFNASVVDEINTSEQNDFRQRVWGFVGEAGGNWIRRVVSGNADVNYDSLRVDISSAVEASMGELSESEKAEFREVYGGLIRAYSELIARIRQLNAER